MAYPKNPAWCLAGTVLLVSSLAYADVPPPPDYVEMCTRAKQELDDEYCELHNAFYSDPYACIEGEGNDPADPEACAEAQSPEESDCCAGWIADGWSYRCKTYGASAYNVLWCRARVDGDPPRPVDPAAEEGEEDDGCSVGAARPRGTTAALLLLLLLGLAGAARRPKTRCS